MSMFHELVIKNTPLEKEKTFFVFREEFNLFLRRNRTFHFKRMYGNVLQKRI